MDAVGGFEPPSLGYEPSKETTPLHRNIKLSVRKTSSAADTFLTKI